ncbi:hypothetical protein M5M_15020 [Simiduia agarivorans SA1 = DSM 21679]|uniref:Uncharacterized protein n=1 Tax=Simiduia agarivorans (strain DSM 21679 / JCM 13881 / BCRC 17597 / SA1) TaxID=1117647 RepID=K4KPS8_SIMAS|nr:hypothetical protein M5M_15020 [Simiduia agarivorans SA1 = DSM 21679]
MDKIVIDSDLPFKDAIPTNITIGDRVLCLVLPIHGFCQLKIDNPVVNLDCRKTVLQCDEAGNRHCDILRQDWTYRYQSRESIAGSMNLHLYVQMNNMSKNLLDTDLLKAHLITLFEAREKFARNIKAENAAWTGEPLDTTPTYLYPKASSHFSERTSGNFVFHVARMGGPFDEIRPWHYYLPVRNDAYICFSFAPEGFPLEDFTDPEARDAFLQSLTEDFMGRMQITANHPVSA